MKDMINLAEYLDAQFDLASIESEAGYIYNDLALAIIDAVFSIGVKYTSVINVINRYKEHYSPPYTVGTLLDAYAEHGIEGMAKNIFENRQRTSTRSGILKSEAVFLYSQVIQKFNAQTPTHMLNLRDNIDFEAEISAIPGQSSGIALTYLYMRCGDLNRVKPDRHIIRFIERGIGISLSPDEASKLLIKTTYHLQKRYPNLVPSALDNKIWDLMANE